MNFDGIPDEALEAIISDARNTLAERRRGVSPRTLPAFLDIDSPDFMGMGMSIIELVQTGQIERNLRSFGKQDPAERNRRLDLAIRLSVELAEISKVTIFSTGLARAAIADVFEGDWVSVKVWVDIFTFGEEPDEFRQRTAPLFARFVGILQEALATVPATPSTAAMAPS